MFKLVLIGIILYLFRRELRRLGPHWRSLVAAGAGVVLGVLYVGLLSRFGVLNQIARALGLGPGGATLVVIVVFGVMGAKTFGPMIGSIFPEREDKGSGKKRS